MTLTDLKCPLLRAREAIAGHWLIFDSSYPCSACGCTGVDPDMEEDKDDTLGGDEDDDLDDEVSKPLKQVRQMESAIPSVAVLGPNVSCEPV